MPDAPETDDGPATFEELGGENSSMRRCRRCGETATHGLSVKVFDRPVTSKAPTVATRFWPVCESCGVRVVRTLDKSLR